HDQTRPNAYEIPTWAIGNAIRRRAAKAQTVVRDDAQPPDRRDGGALGGGSEGITARGKARKGTGKRVGAALWAVGRAARCFVALVMAIGGVIALGVLRDMLG